MGQPPWATGASILAIIDDGGLPANVQLRDGQDLAFVNFDSPLDTTVPQTFAYVPATVDRTVDLHLIAGSVQGPESGMDPIRPNMVRVTTSGGVADY